MNGLSSVLTAHMNHTVVMKRGTALVNPWICVQISYYNQASPEVLPYISSDIAGLSTSFYNIFRSCREYLTANRLHRTSEADAGRDPASNPSSNEADRLSLRLRSTQL